MIMIIIVQQQRGPCWWCSWDGLRCFHHDPLHARACQGGAEDGRQVVSNIRFVPLAAFYSLGVF